MLITNRKDIMEIIHKDIIERDADYSLIFSILNNKAIETLILAKINESGKLIEAYHSLIQVQTTGGVGESDIVLIYEDEKHSKFALFIEDKINADPQPNQRERYDDRAKQLCGKKYDRYYIILCAPQKYINTYKSEGYEICISYEELLPFVNEPLTYSIFSYAINEKTNGYTPVKDELKTEFWDFLYKYVEDKYHALHLKRHNGPRGSSAVWPIFTTDIKGLSIVYKSDRDFVDLEFSGMADRKDTILNLLNNFNLEKYVLANTSKSLSLRYEIPKNKHVSFDEKFNNQIDNIDFALDVISELNEIARKLTLTNVCKFPL